MNGVRHIEAVSKLEDTDLIGCPAPEEPQAKDCPGGRTNVARTHFGRDPEETASQKDSIAPANSSLLSAKAKIVFR